MGLYKLIGKACLKKIISPFISFPQLPLVIRRPGRSQGLVYKHLCNSFIHSVIHSVMVCENIFLTPPRPNGWRWCFQSKNRLCYILSLEGHQNCHTGSKVTAIHLVLLNNSYIWVILCRKNSGPIHVIFSPSLWLQCALLCLPGSLELGCSWTAPQCESTQVINMAKSFFFRQFLLKNFKLSYRLNR